MLQCIAYNTVFSICSQYVEFYKVFPQKVSDKPNGTFMSEINAKSPDKYHNYSLMLSIVNGSS